jgi:hypothetical protein
MVESSRGAEAGGTPAHTMYVGIIHGVRSIDFVAAAENRPGMLGRIAEYVRGQADVQLYGPDARLLDALLQREGVEAAIRFYFERVGEKWDRQWLEVVRVPVALDASAAWAKRAGA